MRTGPKSTGQLTKEMDGLTRFAVMQHLGVLEESGLVLSRREGRQRLNYSNPSRILELFNQWITPLASRAAETAQHLQRYAESQREAIPRMSEQNYRQVKIELETLIQAPANVVYDAITRNYPKWWPHSFRDGAVIYHENKVGGTLGEQWADGGGVAYGTVMWLQTNKKVVTTGVGLFGDYTSTNTETLEEADRGTIYRKKLHLWGDVSAETEDMLRNGARELAEENLRAFCESQ